MGLGGAAGASGSASVLLGFSLINGLLLLGLAVSSSLAARDRLLGRGHHHVRWRRRLSRLLMPALLLALWLSTSAVFALAGDRFGFGWAAVPVFVGSLITAHYLAVIVRRAEFARFGP